MSIHDFPIMMSALMSQQELSRLVEAMRQSPAILTVSSGWSTNIPGGSIGNATIAVVLK